MRSKLLILSLSLITRNYYFCFGDVTDNDSYKWPTVGIAVLVRNKAHTLPYFLSCLRKLDYPKVRVYFWIYSDYNADKSDEILHKWAKKYASEYGGIYLTTNTSSGRLHSDEMDTSNWSLQHYQHVIRLREEALAFARKRWADYLFMVDADVFLTYPLTLKVLVNKDVTVAAPMLMSDGLYSNFWCGMTDNYYYERTDDYKPIRNREKIGCFEVPMVHTAVMIALRRKSSDHLTYVPKKFEGPVDDIIRFAINAKNNGIKLNICNDYVYGFVPVPVDVNDHPKIEYEQVMNIKLEAISRGSPLPLDKYLKEYVKFPKRTKYGCDEIYMINLKRRTERRKLMELSFVELGMDATVFEAVDGRNLDVNNLHQSITLMPDYEDPYHKRPMKAGEVGCFLSHYNIWKEINKDKVRNVVIAFTGRFGTNYLLYKLQLSDTSVCGGCNEPTESIKHLCANVTPWLITKRSLSKTLVLEDDIHFVPYFRHRFQELMEDLKELDWDLVYIGRKILLDDQEQYASKHTTFPLYSYWTLGYLISDRGARKLLDADPLSKMLPVDEFLPIMFDQHPNATWKSYFQDRNLKAYSAAPLLVHPTHYTGQDGYVSDTEDSDVIQSFKTVRSEL